MAKKSAKQHQLLDTEVSLEAESAPESLPIEDELELKHPRRLPWLNTAAVVVGIVLLGALLLVGFERVYSGKVVPGVSAAGVYLGGMSKEAAAKAIQSRITEFKGQEFSVVYGKTRLRFPVSSLDFQFNTDSTVEAAMEYGRQGSFAQQLRARLRSLLSRSTNIAIYAYDQEKLADYITTISASVNTKVSNASLKFSGGQTAVRPSKNGQRLDLGLLTRAVEEHLAKTASGEISAPFYAIEPTVKTEALEAAKHQADTYLSAPVELEIRGSKQFIGIPTIISWISISTPESRSSMAAPSIQDFAPRSGSDVMLTLSKSAVGKYVAGIAARIDQKGQDAALTIRDGKASVFKPSRDGIALDQKSAVADIIDVLSRDDGERSLVLNVKITKPTVTEDSLNDLGIKELIAVGSSTFPGSSAARIQNVYTAANRYNGLLIKPGETFSFGANLGEVSAATGYAPAKVIVNNRQELQYGGGICQVSSTLYRAALLAGLPIVQRTNHSFAVSYYTAPYGVPGVDATIWYPAVDLKFKNDTGHYILIQTVISGVSLKFQMYGTKVKEGRIRGPFFVSGSHDDTKPSRTVFYRDVVVNGKVTKTDTTYTSYKASTDFPDSPQFN